MPKVSARGTGRKSWFSITGSTSCWSACYSAKNVALARLAQQAAAACPGGYRIVAGPSCTNDPPAADPSFLDWGGDGEGWVVCVCAITCEAEIECDGSGQFPEFFGDPVQKWQDLIEAWGIQYSSARADYEAVAGLTEPAALLAAVQEAVSRTGVDADRFLAAYEAGKVTEVSPPTFDQLLDEPDHFGNGAVREVAGPEIEYPPVRAPGKPTTDAPSRRGLAVLIVLVAVIAFVLGTLV